MEELYIVRFYDGMDMVWTDVSEPVSEKEAKRIWNKHTKEGAEKITYNDIDYFHIFPADTRMAYSDG